MEYELVMWNILIQTASSYTILEPQESCKASVIKPLQCVAIVYLGNYLGKL